MGRSVSRRGFMAGAAAIGGLALVGCGPDGQPLPQTSAVPAKLDTFDHVVVLMLENRSFDMVLGSLYGSAGNPDPKFDGIFTADGTRTNPNLEGRQIAATRSTDPVDPRIDPGECWADTNVQLFGSFKPQSNFGLSSCGATYGIPEDAPMTAPYNAPSSGQKPTMDGFVVDYISAIHSTEHPAPTEKMYSKIMQYFDSETLPTIHALAKEFAVFDNWFCDVPSNTFVNRSFFHAADSSGLLFQPPVEKWVLDNDAETVFNQFNDKDVDWAVYFDQAQRTSITHAVNFRQLWDQTDHFAHMDKFYSRVGSGTLPQYSFVEPRMASFDPREFPENDMHPNDLIGRSDARRADLLVNNVYTAIRDSPKRDRTLFLIAFDEHGGLHDHVPPPAAVPPNGEPKPGQLGFTFDRLGVRVPMIAVSSFVKPGTIISDQMQNTSVINTLRHKWDLPVLNARQESAPTFDVALHTTKQRDEWPEIAPPDVAATDPGASSKSKLTDLMADMMEAAEISAKAIGVLEAGKDIGELGGELLDPALVPYAEATREDLDQRISEAVKTLHL
jgi:phospholipase C